jgi:hypothetical protein
MTNFIMLEAAGRVGIFTVIKNTEVIEKSKRSKIELLLGREGYCV